jgi:hypothetical protein
MEDYIAQRIKDNPEKYVFGTVHGSHLYGLDHDGSDKDLFFVTTDMGDGKANHYVADGYDIVELGLGTFLARIHNGSHQSVEALFSDRKIWGDASYRAMLDGMVVTGPRVRETYLRTIKKFSFGDFKRRRHAGRLAVNLWQLNYIGQCVSALEANGAVTVNEWATKFEGVELYEFLAKDL